MKKLNDAIDKLSYDWSRLNWDFRDFKLEDGTPDKMSQWQGDPSEDIMIVVFKGSNIFEPFHRQDFFFIDYAYQMDYNALSSKSDNLITVHEGDCYIGQPFNGYALRGDSKEKEIIMIGVHIKKEAFFKEYLPALSMNADMIAEPKTIIVYSKNLLSPPILAIRCAKSSISPTCVIPFITINNPNNNSNV